MLCSKVLLEQTFDKCMEQDFSWLADFMNGLSINQSPRQNNRLYQGFNSYLANKGAQGGQVFSQNFTPVVFW